MPVPLEEKDISSALSMLAKTLDGTGVVFTKLDLPSRKIGDLTPVASFHQVRYIDLSHNLIADISPLGIIDHMISLNISHNRLKEFALPPLSYLQSLDASHNLLVAFESVDCQYLRDLNLSSNSIERISGLDKNPQLQRLDIDNNKLSSCAGLGLGTLKELALHTNQFADVSGLEGLVLIKSLDLSDNPLANLSGLPTEGILRRLTMKRANITEHSQLEALASIPLEHLDFAESPIAEGLDRVKVLRLLPSLQSLNGDAIGAEEREASLEALPEEEEAPPPAE